MTVGTTESKVPYTGDGVQTSFAYNFPVPQASDMQVFLDEVLQSTGYTVNGAGDPNGGTVVFDTAPANLVIVTLNRVVQVTQNMDLVAYDRFPAETVESAHDKATLIDQQQQEQIDRSIKASIDTAAADYTFPPAEADKWVGWDADTPPRLVNKNHPLLFGNGVPDNTLGDNGSQYTDLDNGDVYVKSAGAWGLQGNAWGQGVPSAGAAGEILAKASGTDFDTEWITQGSNPGSGRHDDTTARDDADSHPSDAISYDNTISGLTASDVKAAIDQIALGADPTGMIRFTARPTATDSGWLLLDGATMGNASSGGTHAGSQFAALFEFVKNIFPNLGTEVFANDDVVFLPDARGRVMGMIGTPSGGSTLRTMGENVGAESHTVMVGQLPSHVHHLSGSVQSAGNHNHGGLPNGPGGPGSGGNDTTDYSSTKNTSSAGSHNHSFNLDTEATGDGDPISNYDPTIFFNAEIRI